MVERINVGNEQMLTTRQELDDLFDEAKKISAKEEMGGPDNITPHETYGYKEAGGYLEEYFLLTSSDARNRKYVEDGSSKESNRTGLDDIKGSTLIGARMLAEIMREQYGVMQKFVITGGTEDGHAQSNNDGLTHADGEKLDIRTKDTAGAALVKALEIGIGERQERVFSWTIGRKKFTQRVVFYLHTKKKQLLNTPFASLNKLLTVEGDNIHLDVGFGPIMEE